MKELDQFGWGAESPDLSAPLSLKDDVLRDHASDDDDVDKLVDAFDAVGAYDKASHGKPPVELERFFEAVESFQSAQGLKTDGIIRKDGPTLARLNELLPGALRQQEARGKRPVPSRKNDVDLTWADVWRERQGQGLTLNLASDDSLPRDPFRVTTLPSDARSNRAYRATSSAPSTDLPNTGIRLAQFPATRSADPSSPIRPLPTTGVQIPIPHSDSETSEPHSLQPTHQADFADALRRRIAAGARWLQRQGYLSPDLAAAIEYAAVGHHFMPFGVSSRWRFSQRALDYFDEQTTGPMGEPMHRWSTEHDTYNEAVAELTNRWLHERQIRPSRMTQQQARDLMREIRESNDPRIRDFNNRAIAQARQFRARMDALRNAPAHISASPGSQTPQSPPATRSAIPESGRPAIPGAGGGGGRSTIMNTR
ncbi:MAG: hypothetical protein JNL66_12550 [Alphaproteobacteria bacterium]|nr:hypothetical protein [Alphaproteobacteria bacterium]